jgi:type 1 glutamine amidotransferase
MTQKLIYPFIFLLLSFSVAVQGQKQFKALLVTTTNGWHHESLHYGVVALKKLAEKNNFDVMLMENPKFINDKNLAAFQVIIFLNTTGDILDTASEKALERFIQSGKGFVGIHSATDTEYDWEWYTKLVGRMFKIHPAIQTAKLQTTQNYFPGLQGFAGNRLWTDEWYEYGPEKTDGLTYILTVDENSYNAKVNWGENKGEGMGSMHPIAWYHEFDGGRAFYTGLGHIPSVFSEQAFLDHLYAGIFWAATGKK